LLEFPQFIVRCAASYAHAIPSRDVRRSLHERIIFSKSFRQHPVRRDTDRAVEQYRRAISVFPDYTQAKTDCNRLQAGACT